jgi:phage-related baseplate assembly protein
MAAAMVGLNVGVSACGGNSGSSGDDKTKVINVTFSGDSVNPNGDRIQVGVNQPIEFVVKADKAGEIHVHSTPEQELKYAAGTTTIPLKIDKPGIITVESHALNKVIVQLEVK